MKTEKKRKIFNPAKSVERAGKVKAGLPVWKLVSEGKVYSWTSKMERVSIMRGGVPYAAIEVIGSSINMPVKDVLHIFGLPQTTYNKKRREKSLLGQRESEIILLLTELIDFGKRVFNGEEDKFQRWMKKPNTSLGGNTPESLLDSVTGIQEVKNSLNRLEFGNLA
ncbi:MbcA/ParS/Xre antitoxin family protein [Flavobacterium sp. MFBS3-15]|uniref:MbcA/ParS/Xre antitoxin family protein n=1 Tax=Flavobacterium sp. MFBS3-15 TaxID=2989816 RepID=UPI002235D07B|nr:MbcA/ParS/Xre antitoxin family protein [Flavobacterium sp. MFBS3-15]MCW4469840.1 MbcA/ParS/Xre antitoxin family protein [Flavobacterium sp. MFBS3-15]